MYQPLVVSQYTYEGNISNFETGTFEGYSEFTSVSGGEFVTGGITQSQSRDKHGGMLKGSKASVGIGAGSPLSVTGGVTTTKIVAPKHFEQNNNKNEEFLIFSINAFLYWNCFFLLFDNKYKAKREGKLRSRQVYSN